MTDPAASRTAKLEYLRARMAARPAIQLPAASTPGPGFCLAEPGLPDQSEAAEADTTALAAALLGIRLALKRLVTPTAVLALILACGWVLLQLPLMTAVYVVGTVFICGFITATCVVEMRTRRRRR